MNGAAKIVLPMRMMRSGKDTFFEEFFEKVMIEKHLESSSSQAIPS